MNRWRLRGKADLKCSLKPACELLCVALQYGLIELKTTLTSYFLDTGSVDYRRILAAAKHVYTNALGVEPWFETLVRKRTRGALVANPDLSQLRLSAWLHHLGRRDWSPS